MLNRPNRTLRIGNARPIGRRLSRWRPSGWPARTLALGLLAFGLLALSSLFPQPDTGRASAAEPAAPAGGAADAAARRKAAAAKRATETKRRAAPGNLTGHGGPVKALAVSAARQQALTGSFDYAMTLWDISAATPRPLHRFDAHEGAVNAVAFVPGGDKVLAAGDDGSLWLWDGATGKLLRRFKGHAAKVNALAVSGDGHYAASASWDRTARLWDLQSMTAGPVLGGHKGPVNAIAFSQDGASVYTASYDGTIGLWDRESGAFRRPLYKHGWGINVLVRLPGSEQLLWGSLNGAVGIADGSTGSLVKQLPAYDRPVLSAAAIAKPGLIATGGGDGVIRVTRIGDWAPIEEYQNPFGPIWALDFLPDGKQMYYGGLDDFATLWQITPRKPFEPIASKFPRRFQIDKTVSAGERQFARKCSICHTLEKDGRNRAGPTLYGVFGRRAGTLPGYPYSDALKDADIVWSGETIGKLFLLGPEHYTPGSKMPLQKIADPKQRQDLIAFLKAATAPPAGADEGKPN